MDNFSYDKLVFAENNFLKLTVLWALLLTDNFQDSMNKVK